MDGYRIANFVMQAICVLLHLLFIIGFLRRRQPTPIWRWFLVVSVGLWMLISGRFFESVAYLFLPSNAFYTFAAYWQFVGTTYATFSYLFWNLHLAGLERAAENKPFRGVMFAVSTAFCVVICTNHHFHLFYEKLVMGEQVVHGPAHTPWIVWVYGMLFVGYVISLVNIIRNGKEKIKRIAVFSMFPLFPAIAALIRSVSGVDELDYTPLVVAVSVFCMYLIVFRRNYVNMIPQTMESALEQTESALILYDKKEGGILYSNKAAEGYAAHIGEITDEAEKNGPVFEKKIADNVLRVSVSNFDGDALKLVTITDVTGIFIQRDKLEKEIAERDAAVRELEDRRRNIDAYLDALYQIPDLKEKQELLTAAQNGVVSAIKTMENNFDLAAENVENCDPFLNDNVEKAKTTIASVRAAVAKLREGV